MGRNPHQPPAVARKVGAHPVLRDPTPSLLLTALLLAAVLLGGAADSATTSVADAAELEVKCGVTAANVWDDAGSGTGGAAGIHLSGRRSRRHRLLDVLSLPTG